MVPRLFVPRKVFGIFFIKGETMEYKNRNPQIFILSGKGESGKNVCANIMQKLYKEKKVIQISYAYYLKQYLKKIGLWDGEEKTKPRSLMQEFGISFLKEKIDKNLLINRVIEDIQVYAYFYDIIIITDARLQEEIEIPKKLFSKVITIRVQNEKENHLKEEEKKHITEIDLDTYPYFDYKVYNNKTLEKQLQKIKEDLYEK